MPRFPEVYFSLGNVEINRRLKTLTKLKKYTQSIKHFSNYVGFIHKNWPNYPDFKTQIIRKSFDASFTINKLDSKD